LPDLVIPTEGRNLIPVRKVNMNYCHFLIVPKFFGVSLSGVEVND